MTLSVSSFTMKANNLNYIPWHIPAEFSLCARKKHNVSGEQVVPSAGSADHQSQYATVEEM